MLKLLDKEVKKLEKKKELIIIKKQNIQKDLDDIDARLKKLHVIQKEYERLEKSAVEIMSEQCKSKKTD